MMFRQECRCESLKDLAAAEGHPEYAQPWPMPSTAIQATPPIASEGMPGMAPAYPANPVITIPVTKAAPAANRKVKRGRHRNG